MVTGKRIDRACRKKLQIIKDETIGMWSLNPSRHQKHQSFTKKETYSDMEKELKPHILKVKIYFQENYAHYIKGNKKLLNNNFTILKKLFENKD